MRIALLQNPWQLSFRGKWTWTDIYNDPRGMSGSELGFVEIATSLRAMGHDVHMYTDSDDVTLGPNCRVVPWSDLQYAHGAKWDLAIAINHPGGLEHFDCPRLMLHWLNSFEFLSRKEIDSVTHWISPSETHRDYILGMTHELSDGLARFGQQQWSVVPLGCTPELYTGIEKVPGRVIYASSPDRGLHHLLQAWPTIKRGAPHAHLKIYYRILPWIAELKAVPEPFDPVEELRQRALFIEEALRRLSDPKWGIEIVGPVSRNGIVQAMGEAEVLAYPVDTTRFSEGFSCTTLEACAAGTQPVLFDCDALGQVYGDVATMVERGDVQTFAERVVERLNLPIDDLGTVLQQRKLKDFAGAHTWRSTCQKILNLTSELLTRRIPGQEVTADSSSSTETTSETPAGASAT